MDISIPNIWQRVGRRSWHQEVKAEGLVGCPMTEEFLLVLHWPVTASYIELFIHRGKEEFAADSSTVLELLRQHQIPQERVPAVLLKGRSHCRALVVGPQDKIALEARINTDDLDFLEEASETEGSTLTQEIEVLAVSPATDSGPPRVEVGALHLHLEPAAPMRKYDGYVALDLGNTNSTIVHLQALGEGHARDIKIPKVEPTDDPGPIPTAVRVTRLKQEYEDDPDRMEEADCLVGNAALDATAGWLVLGAKRILANADPNIGHDFWLERQRYTVRKTLPAELFLSELFRAFHREEFCVSRQIAITHPATFLPREIDQLRQAVTQGWRRSLGAESRNYDSTKLVNPELPQLIIDEASAAAFYFLYRDFLDAPGGLDRLHYLYPEGLNLLVYDCGGGTTDIALVHARVRHGKSRKGQRSAKLAIEVLGRTGHRFFGGDNITIAAFQVLKAKIATRLSGKHLLPYPEIPDNVAELSDFLRLQDKPINAAVPTKFDRDRLGLSEQYRRMETTAFLWQWAERFKIELGRNNPASVEHAEASSKLIHNLAEHHKETGTQNLTEDRIYNSLKGPKIEIHGEEIDALIEEPLKQSIDYANHMIKAKLGRPGSPGGEVHIVYVVGNASRYPAVRKALEKYLEVPFLAQRMGKVGGEDLKNSVAKGAALALRLTSQAQAMDIDFDRRLNQKLPYDITFRYGIAGGYKDIYLEHDDFDQLTEKFLPVPESTGSEETKDRNRVTLSRRWPGDEEPKKFLDFQFTSVIQGPLAVWYDPFKHCFLMRDDGGGGAEVKGQEIEKATYVAPVQSGEI